MRRRSRGQPEPFPARTNMQGDNLQEQRMPEASSRPASQRGPGVRSLIAS